MAQKKLKELANRLLDLGKRNNLLNFKDNRQTTVEILYPAAEDLFREIESGSRIAVYDPELEDEDDDDFDETEIAETPDSVSERDACLQEYLRRGKRNKHEILVYNAGKKNAVGILVNIGDRARDIMESTGVNIAYLAFDFVQWRENRNSSVVMRAPVLLAAVRIERVSALDPCTVTLTDNNIITNPVLSFKLKQEYGIDLPEYTDEKLPEYREKLDKILDRLDWTLLRECRLGLFSFQKMNMYHDLLENEARIMANPNVRILLNEEVSPEDLARFTAGENIAPEEIHCVVDADSSQLEAVQMAAGGKSFVLQGPPGTGKSQTITNLIAECLWRGKTVLFVSEKQAALNVVFNNLGKVDLDEFCLELHSHKATGREVSRSIYQTLLNPKTELSERAETIVQDQEKARRKLDEYAKELHTERPVIGASLYSLYNRFAALRNEPDTRDYLIRSIETRSPEYLKESTALLDQYVGFIPTIGYDYRENPWYGFIGQDTSLEARRETGNALQELSVSFREMTALCRETEALTGTTIGTVPEFSLYQNFFSLLGPSAPILPALLKAEHFVASCADLERLGELAQTITADRTWLDTRFAADIYKLDGREYGNRLKRFDGLLSRLFSGEYRSMVADLKACARPETKIDYPAALKTAATLAAIQQNEKAFREAEKRAALFLPPDHAGLRTDWNAFSALLDAMRAIRGAAPGHGRMADWSEREFTAAQKNLGDLGARMQVCIERYRAAMDRIRPCLDSSLIDFESVSIAALQEKFDSCLAQMDRLPNWIQCRSLLLELKKRDLLAFIDEALREKTTPEHIVPMFRKLFHREWIEAILAKSPVLLNCSRLEHDQVVKLFRETDRQQFTINKIRIRSRLASERPSLVLVAPNSPLAIIKREGEKKRRHMNIRHLLSQAGPLVQKLKPCFLMSPLSVSTFLDPDVIGFDVVIFDEASQVFPQDAIGAIYRASQLIVVGDSQQMPPTNFFNTTIDDSDEEEDAADIKAFESILDWCSAKFPQKSLMWHYRSRCEELIAFSNRHFYDNRLITFPATRGRESNGKYAPGIGVDYYHVADGSFDRRQSRSNRAEARRIVELVYENIDLYPKRSLGVIAFSQAQQMLIARLLGAARREHPESEWFFRQDTDEPFFIKNLETVQGDERDTIIFSVAYGKDAQGRVSHQFGPLNRIGGERRLNVAVTRAKQNVQVVSSMHYTDIDLSRTRATGARLLRDYLDFAENGYIALERSLSVNPFDRFDSAFEMEVCDFLRSCGFTADTQVGCSSFRIDIGLRRPDSSDYVLAVECDGASYHSSVNARDRDRLRQEILERMGWKFYRIWSTDWFRNRSVEQERLVQAARAALETESPVSGKGNAARKGDRADTVSASAAVPGVPGVSGGPSGASGGPEDPAVSGRPEVPGAVSGMSKVPAGAVKAVESVESREPGGQPGTSRDGDAAVSPEASALEVVAREQTTEFAEYEYTDPSLFNNVQNAADYMRAVKTVLYTEAPLADYVLMKRTVALFGSSRVTKSVREAFDQVMRNCSAFGILRKNGFLYLSLRLEDIHFRVPGREPARDVEYIAPEELAVAMLKILENNGALDQDSLYAALARLCGLQKVSAKTRGFFDRALTCLGKRVQFRNGIVSPK